MSASHPTILFDGVCGLCSRAVDFIIRNDRHSAFRFTSLQSPAAKRLLRDHGMDENYFGSMVLIHHGAVYTLSTAVLKVARLMGWPWRIACVGLLIPRPIRDAVYGTLVRNRYRWFGRHEVCRVPTLVERERFISEI